MMIPDKQLDSWEFLAKKTMMVSALGEYTPDEFLILLDAYRELKKKYDDLKFRMDGLEK